MAGYCALIEAGIVVNVTRGDDADWCTEHFGGLWILSESPVGIGWTWDGADFLPPYTPEENGAEQDSTD